MSIFTGSLTTTRPDLAREIQDDYCHLCNLRTAVRALIDNRLVLSSHSRRLITLVDELRDQLAMQFSLEEASGCCECAKEMAPRFSGEVERLRAEHAELYATLAEIAEDAESIYSHGFPPEQVERLVDRLQAFDDALSAHEACETGLVLESADRDLGGEG